MSGIRKRILSIIILTSMILTGKSVYALELLLPGSNAVFIPQDGAILLPELNIVVPTSIDFVIAPFAINEGKQILSEPCGFFNESDVNILVTFIDISLIIAEDSKVITLPCPYDNNDPSIDKEIYMQLDFGREDILPIIITNTEPVESPSVILSAAGTEGSLLSLTLSGSVNPTPYPQWQEGDIKVLLTYRIEPMSDDIDEIDEYFTTQETYITTEQSEEMLPEYTDNEPVDTELLPEETEPGTDILPEETEPETDILPEETEPGTDILPEGIEPEIDKIPEEIEPETDIILEETNIIPKESEISPEQSMDKTGEPLKDQPYGLNLDEALKEEPKPAESNTAEQNSALADT